MQPTRSYIRRWGKFQLSILSLCLNRLGLFFLIVILLNSCKKGPDPLFSNSVISGYCETWDFMNQNSKITVTASGPYGKKIVETGDIGQYFITGLGNGTYRLDYKKDGYGTITQYNIQLFGNDTVSAGQIVLFKKYTDYNLPVFTGTSFETYGSLYLVIESNQKNSEALTPIIFFMDTKNTVDYKNYTYSSGSFSVFRDAQSSENYNIYFDPAHFPFNSGTRVYIIGYVANPTELSSGYFDKYLGMEQLSTLIPEKHSQVLSFIMP